MAAATMYVTRTGSGGSPNGGTSWDDAFSMAEFKTDYEGSCEAGDIYYLRDDGTDWGIAEDLYPFADGTATAPIKIIGVKSGTTATPPTSADWATGGDRPVIAMSSYYFSLRDYYMLFNFEFTGTDSNILLVDSYNTVFNVKCTNSSEIAGRDAIHSSTTPYNIIGCDLASTEGCAFGITGSDFGNLVGCYLHDSEYGAELDAWSTIALCVISKCDTYGINIVDRTGSLVINNTLWGNGSGTGIYGTSGGGNAFINNIIDNWTTEANYTSVVPSNFWAFNCWGDAAPTRTNITPYLGNVDSDPSLSNPAAEDFSIDTNSSADDAAVDAGDYTNATV